MHDVATPYLWMNIWPCDRRALNGEQWDGLEKHLKEEVENPWPAMGCVCACV